MGWASCGGHGAITKTVFTVRINSTLNASFKVCYPGGFLFVFSIMIQGTLAAGFRDLGDVFFSSFFLNDVVAFCSKNE